MENEVKEAVATEAKSSHHHHSHHHHHHHHKSGKKKRKFSLKRFVSKYKLPLRFAAFALAFALTVSCTVFTVKFIDNLSRTDETVMNPPVTAPQLPEGQMALRVTLFDGAVALHHDAVGTYLTTSTSVAPKDIFGQQTQTTRMDQGKPLELSFGVMGLPDGSKVTGYRVELTEKGERNPVFRKDCGPEETAAAVYNLKTATTYQYTIRADFDKLDAISVSGTFSTASGPRLLKVDGIANVRDLGGWKVGNTAIKQGLLFRGTELDGENESSFLLEASGRKTLVEQLEIRTELDLRAPSERPAVGTLGVTVLGPYNMPFYDNVFATPDTVRQVFQELANPDNYPIYMHCTHGRDRTGIVSLILGAVLGMEEDDLIREYGLTALAPEYKGQIGYAEAYTVLDGLKTYAGNTLAQQAENYLLSIGLTDAEIASLRQIYLG